MARSEDLVLVQLGKIRISKVRCVCSAQRDQISKARCLLLIGEIRKSFCASRNMEKKIVSNLEFISNIPWIFVLGSGAFVDSIPIPIKFRFRFRLGETNSLAAHRTGRAEAREPHAH